MDVLALAWFPKEELGDALLRWPDLVTTWDDATDSRSYNRAIERELRRYAEGGTQMVVAPIRLDAFLAWCDAEGVDPDGDDGRARYAIEVAREGDGIDWPPGRGDPCWCGSGQTYAFCCAAA